MPRPGHFTPGKQPQYPTYRQLRVPQRHAPATLPLGNSRSTHRTGSSECPSGMPRPLYPWETATVPIVQAAQSAPAACPSHFTSGKQPQYPSYRQLRVPQRHAPATLPLGNSHNTHHRGSSECPIGILDGCGKSCHHRDLIPAAFSL